MVKFYVRQLSKHFRFSKWRLEQCQENYQDPGAVVKQLYQFSDPGGSRPHWLRRKGNTFDSADVKEKHFYHYGKYRHGKYVMAMQVWGVRMLQAFYVIELLQFEGFRI